MRRKQWENDVRISHLSAVLNSVGHHDPKKLPPSADELLGETKHKAAYSEDQWRGLAAALKQQFSPKKPKKKRKT